jgi:hypothetical protein
MKRLAPKELRTKARFTHNVSLDETEERRLSELRTSGITIIDILKAGLELKEKELLA